MSDKKTKDRKKTGAQQIAGQSGENAGAKHKQCPKCGGEDIRPMNFHPSVALDFSTYYLGDLVIPKLHICLACGYSEMWIDSKKDLTDVQNYFKAHDASTV